MLSTQTGIILGALMFEKKNAAKVPSWMPFQCPFSERVPFLILLALAAPTSRLHHWLTCLQPKPQTDTETLSRANRFSIHMQISVDYSRVNKDLNLDQLRLHFIGVHGNTRMNFGLVFHKSRLGNRLTQRVRMMVVISLKIYFNGRVV